MSAVYYIEMNINIKENLLSAFNYKYNKEELAKIFAKNQIEDILVIDNLININSDFNSCYSWEEIMINTFQKMIPYLNDNSSLRIEIENDYDELIIKNGILEWLH